MAQRNVSRGKERKNTRNSRGKFGRKAKGSAIDTNSEINLQVGFSAESAFISNNLCVSPSKSSDDLNLRWELSSMNVHSSLWLQSNVSPENSQKKTKTFEGPSESIMYGRHVRGLNSSMDYGNSDFGSVNQLLMGTSLMDSSVTEELEQEKNSVKQESVQAHSITEFSDHIEEDGGQEVVRKLNTRYTSKNIEAERKRRTKLKESLYALRSLVPKITKMDRASILGDAIEYAKDLQNQVKELQDELRALEEEGEMNTAKSSTNNIQAELPLQNVVYKEARREKNESVRGLKIGIQCSSTSIQIPSSFIVNDMKQQMKVKVEVTKIDGNKFFLNVLCEHKRHGFARLMEAIDSLGLELKNVNITTCRGLVSTVLQIEMGDNETIEADQLRDLLVVLIQNPIGGWCNS